MRLLETGTSLDRDTMIHWVNFSAPESWRSVGAVIDLAPAAYLLKSQLEGEEIQLDFELVYATSSVSVCA